MKKTRKILAVALFLLLMLTPVVSVSQPVTVQAAARAARSAIPITLEQMVQPIRPTKK